MTELIRLRGHHLLCLLTYIGRGYSPAFIVNMDGIAARITSGSAIVIVDGPDDLCTPLQRESHACAGHCLTPSTGQRDILALASVGALLGLPLQTSVQITLSVEHIALMRQHFRDEPNFRRACAGCEWHGLCDDIAAGGFQGALLSAIKNPA